ncbi:hypothetical protein D3C71_2236860 [compost metagenome]
MAKLKQVALRLGAVLKQLQQRVAERRAQRLCNKVATALTTDQQPLCHQLLNRLTQ